MPAGLRVNSGTTPETRPVHLRLQLIPLSCVLLWAAAAGAQEQEVVRAGPVANTYALLVGENAGGEGQAPLHYAQADAQRVAEVLTELGRLPKERTHVLLGVGKAQLLAQLQSLGDELRALHARGEQAQLVFYYSGHAKASALHLGAEELPLAELRERLLQLPTTLTLIVLDACQSGAFSRVKGAEPAADFSYNSVSRLQTQGVAVMASSTGSELSQESETLHGSYFTHHLVVALRGAGDRDGSGVVSLAEAYQYAYDHTLSTTARTAVGEQHVTLETALTGQGEVPITYPAEASAQLELPAELATDALVEHAGSVLAELHKVAGAPLRLALPAGVYNLLLRAGELISECPLQLQDGQVTRVLPSGCHALSPAQARAKGYLGTEPPAKPRQERWGVELNFGLGDTLHDAYTRRLQDFGFSEQVLGGGTPLRLWLAVSRQFLPHLSAVADLRNFDNASYQRDLLSTASQDVREHFSWSSYALGLQLRAHGDLFHDHLRLYGQLGGGLGYAHSSLKGHGEDRFGPQLAATAGVFYMPWRHFGFTTQLSYAYVPVLANELGDRHDSGGVQLTMGIRYRSWGEP